LPRYVMAAPGGREVADGALSARELGDFAPVRVHDVDLVVAVAVAGERDLLAVARPRRIKMPDGGRSVGEGGDSAPVRVHDVDLVCRLLLEKKNDRAFRVVAGSRPERRCARRKRCLALLAACLDDDEGFACNSE